MINSKNVILYLFAAALFTFGFTQQTHAQDAQAQEAQDQTQERAQEEAGVLEAPFAPTAGSRRQGPRFGMRLAPDADEIRITSPQPRVYEPPLLPRFTIRVGQREEREEEEVRIHKRIMDPNEIADRDIMLFVDSVFAPPPAPEEDTTLDFSALSVRIDERLRTDMRDSAQMSRMPRLYGWLGYGMGVNVGFGLVFPVFQHFGLRGEFSFMHTAYAKDSLGYRDGTYTVLDTATAFTIPVLANLMIRPNDFMLDVFGGISFLGNKEDVTPMVGAALGGRIGNGYLFGDTRFGWSTGERFWSVGIGYEYVPAFMRYAAGKRRHSIVAPADTLTLALAVSDERGGQISPAGEHRVVAASHFGLATTVSSGWNLDALIVNDTMITGDISTYSFERVRNSMRILALLRADSVTVTLVTTHPATGDLVVIGETRVQKGDDRTFTVSPPSGYLLSHLVVNGVNVGEQYEYLARNIDRDLVLEAHFNEVVAIDIKPTATVQEGINFATATATLTADSRRTLEGIAITMIDYPGTVVEIAGHTDNVGGREYNIGLSQRRARAVVDFLISRDVEPERLVALGYGFDKPIADNRTARGRALNRRVEIRTIENPAQQTGENSETKTQGEKND